MDSKAISAGVTRVVTRQASQFADYTQFVVTTNTEFPGLNQEGDEVVRKDLWLMPSQLFQALNKLEGLDEDAELGLAYLMGFEAEKRNQHVCTLLTKATIEFKRTLVAAGEVYDETKDAASRDMYLTEVVSVKLAPIGKTVLRKIAASVFAF